ncbi:MAG TPA: SDR family oxidoreductase [Candidatus Sulfotelmatobacter sp.]|nr:SDR family oxidoreductase [Candidatus Sulfotelmatobacter sp.]
MKIVVIGGTGLIGSKLVNKLREQGHEAVAAAPNTGVNSITGEGLTEALRGASVVVDVSNAPDWEDSAVLKFFETSTRNLLAAEAQAAVKHHVALSVVGTDKLAESGYFRAKIAQEKLIRQSSIPYTIVHATQFFEFLKGLADISMVDGKVHLAPVLFQPMAADDVATGVARVAVGQPVNGIVEIGGPEQFRVDELVRRRLASLKDPRQVIADPNATYAGAKLSEKTLVPGNNARLGGIRFENWLAQQASQGHSGHPQPAAASVEKERQKRAS